jgi:predicted ATP-binding protein involved in virulence
LILCGLNPKKAEGLVLVDDITAGLNPQDQPKVLPMFRKLFPKLQLICTTSSPFLIPGMSAEDSLLHIGSPPEKGSVLQERIQKILSVLDGLCVF